MKGALLVVLLLGACLPERSRPGPLDPAELADLEAVLVTPASGATVPTGEDIPVTVDARDLNLQYLEGVGFVARRGGAAVDSGAVRFSPRADSVHVFTFEVPDTLATNTQLDVYGIAFGPGSLAILSAPSHLTVVHCENGMCR